MDYHLSFLSYGNGHYDLHLFNSVLLLLLQSLSSALSRFFKVVQRQQSVHNNTVIPRLTKIIRSEITFVRRNLCQPKRVHFSYWNGPTVRVCCFMLARASTKTFVSRVRIRQPSPKKKTAGKNVRQPKNSLAGSLVSRGISVVLKPKVVNSIHSPTECSKHRNTRASVKSKNSRTCRNNTVGVTKPY